jgi:hypothetical protein
MRLFKLAGLTGVALAVSVMSTPASAMPLSDEAVTKFSRDVLFGTGRESDAALRALAARKNPDVVAVLVQALRIRRRDRQILGTLSTLAGVPIKNWRDAMLWQEAHADVTPHASFRTLKIEVLETLDPKFLRFLGGDKSHPENLKIRLEEIVWGGVKVDGIPSLDNPELIPAADASYLRDTDLVFGVEINGDARAYPLPIMGWHEMFNDTIGGVPVALA